MSKKLTVRAQSNDVAELLIYDVIGADFFGEGVTAKDVRDAVKAVKAPTLNLRINSPGGSVFEASAILAALDGFKGRLEVDIDGVAASAASVIAMAGDVIRVGTNAMMMIHQPHALVIGGSKDMRDMAELLDKAAGQIIDAYERHSKAGREQLAAWMDAETWFTGQEAIDAGLAHEVTAARQVAACADLARVAAKLGYKHVPAALTETPPAEARAWAETNRRAAVAAMLMKGAKPS